MKKWTSLIELAIMVMLVCYTAICRHIVELLVVTFLVLWRIYRELE